MLLDVGDSAQVYAAFLVYLDMTEGEEMTTVGYLDRSGFFKIKRLITLLCSSFEVRKWKEVVGVPCPELQAVLLEGREKEGETVQMVYPLPSHRSIKHRE